MTYAELSEAQARRSRQFAEAQTDAMSVYCDAERDLKELQAENAKLRELLLDVWNDAMQFDGFWDYVNDDGEIYNEDELPHYYDRMRELGLEVE